MAQAELILLCFLPTLIEALARCLLPEIQKFFESEEGKNEFEEWQTQQKAKTNNVRKKKEHNP